MTPTPPDELERGLRELTAWVEPAPQLWKAALRAADATRARSGRIWTLRPSRRQFDVALVGVVALLFVAVLTSLLTPSLSRAREFASPKRHPVATENLGLAQEMVARRPFISPSTGNAEDARRNAPARLGDRWFASADGLAAAERSVAKSDQSPSEGDNRQVIRKATIELAAADVRAAYLKAALLISEAQGEYVQDLALTGTGRQTQANLTLRVAAARLPQVLDALRGLGTVRAEQASGEDVTDQVIDLDARLRNDQRVETELLKLLESRKDAPLKEILELRDKLADVRRTIEQLTAQRERIGRLVALATVLVLIRAEDAPATAQPGIGAYFLSAIAKAWIAALRVLADTVAYLLTLAVGGAIWWALLATLLVVLVRRLRASRGGA
ncbi:hypothetical protein RAS1_20540 [Phycisphaerae bacterium RAS1]|nr:hypothetical protein RAS1_20540 [Phycisphaerae bacterium RAS1]